jgi:hypothetical protein
MWNCAKCREKRIDYYIHQISYKFMDLPCVHIFVGKRTEKGKDLSNFTSQNVSGRYCRINGLNTSAIISDRKFDGAARYYKKKFLEKTLPEILNQPWAKGRRVSFSKEWIETKAEEREKGEAEKEKGSNRGAKEEESGYWAMIVGDVCKEFSELRSDEERRGWLTKQSIYQLYKKGENFLGQEAAMK